MAMNNNNLKYNKNGLDDFFRGFILHRLHSDFKSNVVFEKPIRIKLINKKFSHWFRFTKEQTYECLRLLEQEGYLEIKQNGRKEKFVLVFR